MLVTINYRSNARRSEPSSEGILLPTILHPSRPLLLPHSHVLFPSLILLSLSFSFSISIIIFILILAWWNSSVQCVGKTWQLTADHYSTRNCCQNRGIFLIFYFILFYTIFCFFCFLFYMFVFVLFLLLFLITYED